MGCDGGTKFTLLGKPKFVTLADAIHSRKLLELCKAVRGFDIRVVSEIFSAKLIFVSFSICQKIEEWKEDHIIWCIHGMVFSS
jgi:hypothetical protein